MPEVELVVLAAAEIGSRWCVAGMTAERDRVTGLRWISLGSESGWFRPPGLSLPHLRPFGVVAPNILHPDPRPPYTERWVTDPSPEHLCIARRLEDPKRARFLATHTDSAPHQVLDSQQRSLCLIQPDWIHGTFRRDPSTGRFDARLAFGLGRKTYRGPFAQGGLTVTDPAWHELGHAWLPEAGGWTEFDLGDMEARYGTQEVYLVVGLTPETGGAFDLTILAVHAVPDIHGPALHAHPCEG